MINLEVDVDNEEVDTSVDTDIDVELGVENVTEVSTNDYEKLINLPSLNGETIIGDMNEQDPTVPKWAKEPTKPDYSAEEVDAVSVNSALTFQEIDEIFNSIF
jgi:hypothetical protein